MELICISIGSFSINYRVMDGGHTVLNLSIQSKGIKNGNIINIKEASASLVQGYEDLLRRSTTLSAAPVVVMINNPKMQFLYGHGVISTKDEVISGSHINHVLEVSSIIPLPTEWRILHTQPNTFTLDEIEEITDPINMVGTRFECHSTITTTLATVIHNIKRTFEVADIQLDSIYSLPMVYSGLVNGPTTIIDCGHHLTTIFDVKESGQVSNVRHLNFGFDRVIKDISYAFKLADKDSFELLTSKLKDPNIKIKSFAGEREVEKISVEEVAAARQAELLELIEKEVNTDYPITVCGGAIKLPHFEAIAKEIFGSETQCREIPYERGLKELFVKELRWSNKVVIPPKEEQNEEKKPKNQVKQTNSISSEGFLVKLKKLINMFFN